MLLGSEVGCYDRESVRVVVFNFLDLIINL